MKGQFRDMLATFVIAAGMAGAAAPAHAEPILEMRCASDSLSPAQARVRLEWARACGDRINVKSPGAPVPPAISYLTGQYSTNGNIPLTEYVETDDFYGKNSYSGDTADVNQMFVQNQWRPSAWAAANDVNGFQKWTGPTTLLLPRPMYPTFGTSNDINAATQLFSPPIPCDPITGVCAMANPNDCRLFTDPNGTTPYNGAVTGFYVNGYCTSSCYLPEEQITFAGGNESILDAMNELRTGVTTLTPKSTLDDIKVHTDDVASYTHDIHDADQVIFTIKTKSGGELKVTDKHPILEGDGRIVQARSVKVGNYLIKADGTRDEVVAVAQAHYFGKVYNLKPASTNRVANILIAQGFLVGSSRFQNDDVDFINRIILGRGIPENVIPR